MKHVCGHQGCGQPAKWAPKLCVPAVGWPVDLHQPVSALLNMPVCDECFAALKAPDFVAAGEGNKLREAIVIVTRAREPPDFDRAFFTKVRLDSDEYRNFEKARSRHV